MNPDDLIHAVPAVAKGAAALGAAIPFTAIVRRMLGPAADEVAEMWRDQVRVYRYGRQLKLLEKAERMAQDAGFTPQAVPPKILFPLLEGASFEDNEDLHTMWAALFANAASPDSAKRVRAGFIATLRQLSSDEAALLEFIYDHVAQPATAQNFDVPLWASELVEHYATLGFGELKRGPDGKVDSIECDISRFGTCLDSLVAEQLIARRGDVVPQRSLAAYSLTFRGYEFVSACRPPKPKA